MFVRDVTEQKSVINVGLKVKPVEVGSQRNRSQSGYLKAVKPISLITILKSIMERYFG